MTDTPTIAAPLRSRYLLAALLVLTALGAVVMWGLLTVWASDDLAAGLDRTAVPGELTVDLHPGTWVLYAEGDVTVDRVQVSYPDGTPVPVSTDPAGGATYEHRGRAAEPIASFELPRVGELPDMQIVVEGRSGDPEASVALAESDQFDHLTVQRWGMLALLVVNIGAAVLIVVVPLVRHRRSSRSAPARIEPTPEGVA